jgi:hypothetical protein
MTTYSIHLDPWLSMWLRPRATVRQVLDTNPNSQVLLLAALSGIVNMFGNAAARSLGDRVPLVGVIALCVLGGALGGILGLYLGGALLAWMGRTLGGHGQAPEVRTALAWAAVPTIWGGILLVPELILFQEELFTSATPRIDANPILEVLLLVLGLIEIVIGLWTAVVFLKSLGEAHRFSAWRSLATTFLAGLVIAAPFLCLGVLALLGSRASG